MKRSAGFFIAIAFLSILSADAFALTLDEAINLALENNKQILAQKKQVEIIRQNVREAQSSFYPQLSIDGGYTYFDKTQDITLPTGNRVETSFNNNYSAALSINQLIFDWGKTPNLVGRSKSNLIIEEERLRYLENQTIFNIKEVFYQIVYLSKGIEAHKESLNAAEENLRISKEKNIQGTLSKYETVRAEVQVENIKPNIIWAENELSNALKDLETIIGIEIKNEEVEKELPFNFKEVQKDEMFELAKSYNSILKQLDLEKEVIKKQRRIDSSLNKPKLYGFYSYSFLNPFGPADEWERVQAAGVKVSFPFFDGFKTSSLVSKDRLSLDKNAIMKEDAGENIEKEMEKAYLDFVQARQLAKAQEASIKQARLGLEIARTRFKEGLSTQVELLDAQSARLAAETNLNTARYKLAKSYFLMQFLSGGPIYE